MKLFLQYRWGTSWQTFPASVIWNYYLIFLMIIEQRYLEAKIAGTIRVNGYLHKFQTFQQLGIL